MIDMWKIVFNQILRTPPNTIKLDINQCSSSINSINI